MKPQMEEKRLRARSAIAKNCPVLMADEKAIRQVLLNLLSNAMKFTPEGGAIRAEVRLPAAGGVRWTVSVTGIRWERPTPELRSLMRTSYAVCCLKKKKAQTYIITA